MSDMIDPVPSWTRQLAHLRTRALKVGLRRAGGESALADVLEDALTTWGTLLREFAGAQLESERLRAELRAQTDAWQHLFAVMPGACVLTDVQGVISEANQAAAELFNVSARHLRDRQLFLFTDDRDAFGELLRRLSEQDAPRRVPLRIRPRERRPLQMDVVVAAVSSGHPLWLWFFAPGVASRSADADASFRQSA